MKSESLLTDYVRPLGLDDFPWTQVHMMESERDYAIQRKTWLDRQRFRPEQWNTRANWNVYRAHEGDSWFGFSKATPLEGKSDEIALVPLMGHTFGHAGIAVKGDDKWLLNAGNAYFYHDEMNLERPYCTPGLQAYQLMMDKDHRARLESGTTARFEARPFKRN